MKQRSCDIMKKLCIILSMLLIFISVSACISNNTTPITESSDYLSEIMKKSHEYPQLSKDEFIEITNNYLSAKEWVLPSEKACFYTYGINYSAYIIEDEYLFSLNTKVNTDGSVEYDFYLSHYIDGVVSESETDPLLFEKFIK